MIDRLSSFFRKREARSFRADITDWYEACRVVSETLVDALHDESVGHSEIGVVLDKVDRKLYGLRDSLHTVRRPLKQRNKTLARRVDKVTERIFHLRNQATSFMIRSQGPIPPYLDDTAVAKDRRRIHYLKAMEEKGFEARRVAREVAAEIKAIWTDLQPLIADAENMQ